MSRTSKRYLILAIIFSIVTIAFGLLYHYKVISRMDLNLSVIYICYFVGIALLYNGAYLRENSQRKATTINFLFGILFVLVSIGLLIYGFATGTILLF